MIEVLEIGPAELSGEAMESLARRANYLAKLLELGAELPPDDRRAVQEAASFVAGRIHEALRLRPG